MWFFVIVIGIVIAYISGRKWGNQLYNYYRPRLNYILPYVRWNYRPVGCTTLQSVETVESINAKKKFDLDSVMIHNWKHKIDLLHSKWNRIMTYIFLMTFWLVKIVFWNDLWTKNMESQSLDFDRKSSVFLFVCSKYFVFKAIRSYSRGHLDPFTSVKIDNKLLVLVQI